METLGQINIIKSSSLKQINNGLMSISFNDKHYDDTIYICPYHLEHVDSIEFLRLRLYCDEHNTKIVACGRLNYLPFFSVFADEAIFYDSVLPLPNYYGESPSAIPLYSPGGGFMPEGNTLINGWCDEMRLDAPTDKWYADAYWKRLITTVSDNAVSERFWSWHACVLDSAYEIWKQQQLLKNLTVYEVTAHNIINSRMKAEGVIGAEHRFQKDLLAKVGADNYMSVQLLSSSFLNWVYVCAGGSANLMSVLPTRVACLSDMLTEDKKSCLRKIYDKRGNIPFMFCCGADWNETREYFTRDWDNIKRLAECLKLLPPPVVVEN